MIAERKTESLQAEPLRAIDQKFLMKLFGHQGHQAHISELSPNPKTPATKRDRICQTLAESGFVEYDSEIFRFTLAPAGRVLLTLQTTSLPVTPDELKLLRACKGSMPPAKLGTSVPANARAQLIMALVDRKLLKVVKTAIATVYLTEKGKQFLQAQQNELVS